MSGINNLTRIRIFGFDFTLVGNRYQFYQGVPPGISNTNISIRPSTGSGNNVLIRRLYFTHSGITYRFSCPFEVQFGLQNGIATPLRLTGPSNSVLFELIQGSVSTRPGSPRVNIDVGPLRIVEHQCSVEIKEVDGYRDLWIRLHNEQPLLDDNSLPLAVFSNKGTLLRLFYHNNKCELQLDNQPFTLHTRLGLKSKLWHIPQQDYDIAELKAGTELTFQEDADNDDPLYLHPFMLPGKNDTLAALGVDAGFIKLKLARNTNDAWPLLITGLEAIVKSEGCLHSWGLVANNEPGYHRWGVANTSLPLVVRKSAGPHTPAGLLLKPQPQQLIPEYPDSAILGLRREVKLSIIRDASLKFSATARTLQPHPQIGQAISADATTPYIETRATQVVINRPGTVLYKTEPQSIQPLPVESWHFKHPADTAPVIAFPVFPDEAVPDSNALQSLHQLCNSYYQQMISANSDVTHESNLRIASSPTAPDGPALNALFHSNANQAQPILLSANSANAPLLGQHTNIYNFGNYVVTRQWQENEVPEYIPLIVREDGTFDPHTMAEFKAGAGFSMDPAYANKQQDIRVSWLSTDSGLALAGSTNKLIGIVKLGKAITLSDIFRQVHVEQSEKDNIETQLPGLFLNSSWVGLVLFEQALDLSQFKLLDKLIPPNSLKLRYLAITPTEIQKNTFATYGLAVWSNTNPDGNATPENINQEEEVLVKMMRVEASWAGRQLTHFLAQTRLEFRSIFGARHTNSSPIGNIIDVLGSIDKETGQITFLAQSQKPKPLLGTQGVGPLRQVYVKQIRITHSADRIAFNVDGDIELQDFQLDNNWKFDNGGLLKFNGLKFGFVGALQSGGQWLTIDYPSLQFEPVKGWQLLNFANVTIELRRLGFDTVSTPFDWAELINIKRPASWPLNALRLGLHLNLGKLPLLSQNPLKELIFDFELALPYKNNFTDIDLNNCCFGIKALGFSKLNIKLMRFLELSADEVSLESKTHNNMQLLWFFLSNLRLKILDKPLIKDGLTFGHYWGPQQKGFIGLIEDEVKLGILNIDWVLIGRNLVLNGSNNNLIERIVSTEPLAHGNLRGDIKTAYNGDSLIPANSPAIGEWVFAAGFRLFGDFLEGKFLFQDGAYYGIAIHGPFLKDWFGYELAISVLYIVKEREEEDIFRLELRVPSVELGGFSFNGGVIVIEIQMNGGFLLDIGYPWLAANGERQWDRGFGVIISGLMGRGGCFIAKRSSMRSRDLTNGKLILLEGGHAVMVGIGGAFRAGPLRVTVYAGIYYSCEGGLLFFSPQSNSKQLQLIGLRLSGAIGIQARGIAELEWWVISIRVEVVAGAEARLTLFWGALQDYQPGSADLPAVTTGGNDKITVQVDFILYARVGAKACIGSGWFKVCKSINVGISMPYRTTLELN